MRPPTSSVADVVVVGGGIVGTAAASFLAGAGARVALVEREGLASGASGANSGIVQHPFDPVLAALYRETVSLYRELSAVSTGFQLASQPAGMLFVAEQEAAAHRQAALISESFPELRIDVIGGTELQALEPAVGPDLWACRVDIGYPVMPGASTYAYATLAEERGAEIRLGRAATLEVEHVEGGAGPHRPASSPRHHRAASSRARLCHAERTVRPEPSVHLLLPGPPSASAVAGSGAGRHGQEAAALA